MTSNENHAPFLMPGSRNQNGLRRVKRLLSARSSGMSIIELSIVIFIGALILAGVFGAFKWVETTREQNTDRALGSLDQRIEMYATRIGEYPRDLDELITGPTDPKLQRRWAGPEVENSDLRDAWGKDFEYELLPPGSPRKYELYSMGKTGEGPPRRSPASR